MLLQSTLWHLVHYVSRQGVTDIDELTQSIVELSAFQPIGPLVQWQKDAHQPGSPGCMRQLQVLME